MPSRAGHFVLRTPGGVAHLEHIAGASPAASGEAALVRAIYRNRAGAARTLLQRLLLEELARRPPSPAPPAAE